VMLFFCRLCSIPANVTTVSSSPDISKKFSMTKWHKQLVSRVVVETSRKSFYLETFRQRRERRKAGRNFEFYFKDSFTIRALAFLTCSWWIQRISPFSLSSKLDVDAPVIARTALHEPGKNNCLLKIASLYQESNRPGVNVMVTVRRFSAIFDVEMYVFS
jgi:hypothetical protein